MKNLKIKDFKTFVGSKNYQESKDFYIALGWTLNFESDQLSELELSGFRFYLQNYYDKTWCENSMLHIIVDDVQAWYETVKSVLEKNPFGGARVEPPRKQDYGALVSFVWDPSGVLLHFAQYIESSS